MTMLTRHSAPRYWTEHLVPVRTRVRYNYAIAYWARERQPSYALSEVPCAACGQNAINIIEQRSALAEVLRRLVDLAATDEWYDSGMLVDALADARDILASLEPVAPSRTHS